MRHDVRWTASPGAAPVGPSPVYLTARNTFREAVDRIETTLEIPVVELYALRFSDRFNEETGTAEGTPHLARGVSGEERMAELRESVAGRLRRGQPPFTTAIEVGFGSNKEGPYVKDGHHRLAIAQEFRIRTIPVQVPRGIARELGWFDLGRRRFPADIGRAGLNEYDLFRDAAGSWVARWQQLPERLGDPVATAVILGRYPTQPEAMHACVLNANGLPAPGWWKDEGAAAKLALFPVETRSRREGTDLPAVEGGSVLATTGVRDSDGAPVLVRAVESSSGAPWLETWACLRTRGGGREEKWTRVEALECESWDRLQGAFLARHRGEVAIRPTWHAVGREPVRSQLGSARGRGGIER